MGEGECDRERDNNDNRDERQKEIERWFIKRAMPMMNKGLRRHGPGYAVAVRNWLQAVCIDELQMSPDEWRTFMSIQYRPQHEVYKDPLG